MGKLILNGTGARGLTRRDLLRRGGSVAMGGAALSALGPIAPALAQDKIFQWGSASLGSTGYQIITVLTAAVSKHTELRNRWRRREHGSDRRGHHRLSGSRRRPTGTRP